jgi:hypothetical protein
MPVLDHLAEHHIEHQRLVRERELIRRTAARSRSPEEGRSRPARLALLDRLPLR